ncbi:MAG: FAD:protein FMN transferase [Planctomycetia bacterium]|nr:FAD:protein FMN transferase [Planctomycetia bacterium]
MEDAPDLHTLVVGRDAMACRFELVFNAGEVAGDTQLAVEMLDLVEEIEARITVYRDTSELARINASGRPDRLPPRGPPCEWQEVAPDLFELLLHARDLHDRTAGGFDVASGTLSRAWGFLERQGRVPSAEQLARAREASGMRWVEFDPPGRRLRFTRPGVELNLGAIGKGWAIDRVIDRLRLAGVASVLVHGGSSSVRAFGIQGPDVPGRAGWRVGVRHPLRPGRRLATVTLEDRALGTSGSGTQFFVDRGRKLGHIIDPRSGVPAEGVLSATVVTPCAADADALATALYVLGPDGLERVAAATADGGSSGSASTVGCLLVLPGRSSGSVRLLVANLDDRALVIEPGEGVEIERVGDG